MPEVLAVSDRVEVLRMGRRVAVYQTAQTSVEELVGAMTGALELRDGPAPPDATIVAEGTADERIADAAGASGDDGSPDGRRA
jgi:ABC-type sugar transport system ATPase subunit